MAITTVGFDGTVTEAQWSRLMRYTAQAGYHSAVFNGFNVAVGGGTRRVSVNPGTALLPGVLVDSSTSVTLTLGANSGSGNRVDYIVLRGDWSANTVTLVVSAGASATPPTLTQTEGSIWELPLARVTIRPSVTTLLASDIVAAKPLPGNGRTFRGSAIAADSMLATSTGKSLSTLDITDPGRPYQLDITARLRLSGDTGTAQLQVMSGGVAVAGAFSAPLSSGATVPIVCVDSATALTGPVSLDMRVSPVGASSPMSWGGGGNNNFLLVRQTYV